MKNTIMKRFFLTLAVAMMTALTITSCTTNNQSQVPEAAKCVVGLEKYQTKIDYSQPQYWLALPDEITKPVDVFFIYPTVTGYRGITEVCDIDDSVMVAGAHRVLKIQASVFAESCNVFMPYYRQISLPSKGTDYQAIIDYISQFDATDALDYYLNNLNQGRPFIIAGHSQGASTVISLLENYMTKHPEALNRMVAAYPIGFSVTDKWLEKTGLKFAEGPTDVGVIVTWNTEGPGNHDASSVVVAPGAISINPINWKRDDTYAPAEENLGSLNYETASIDVPGIADARVDTERGVVVVTTVDPAKYAIPESGWSLFGPECYHVCDYSFFYNNIRQNVADRIAEWFANEINR